MSIARHQRKMSSRVIVNIPSIHRSEINISIPRRIMQTWKTRDIPDKWKSSLESIHRFMPQWEHVLMSDEDNRNFVQDHFPDFLPYYDGFEYNIQRADAIRYCYLYVHGGLYMDLDMEIQHPLDDLFISNNDIYLVDSGNIGGYITNSLMASKPKCPLWLDMIEEMKKPLPWWAVGKHMKVMNSTGPIALNRVVKRNGYVYGALPRSKVMACSICDATCFKPDAYIVPLQGSSWIAFDTVIYNFFLCNWKKIILLVVLSIIIFIIWRLLRKNTE
jgi:inositol phosphorylceramide mannosyltransferase catalytic subunit